MLKFSDDGSGNENEGPKGHKDSEQFLMVIRKMFVIGDESRINGSDVYEPSMPGIGFGIGGGLGGVEGSAVGRSQSIITDNNIADRNRYLNENFEFIEYISVGSLSCSIKIRGKTTGTLYLLKCVRKLKFRNQHKKAH